MYLIKRSDGRYEVHQYHNGDPNAELATFNYNLHDKIYLSNAVYRVIDVTSLYITVVKTHTITSTGVKELKNKVNMFRIAINDISNLGTYYAPWCNQLSDFHKSQLKNRLLKANLELEKRIKENNSFLIS